MRRRVLQNVGSVGKLDAAEEARPADNWCRARWSKPVKTSKAIRLATGWEQGGQEWHLKFRAGTS